MAPVKTGLTAFERNSIRELVITRWLEAATLKDLERFFIDINTEMLDDLGDDELLGTLEDNTSKEEYQQFLEKVVSFSS